MVAAGPIIISMPDNMVDAALKIQLILFDISLIVALVGIHLGLDARAVIIERRKAVEKYERPQVVEILEVLFVDMAQTMAIAKRIDYKGVGAVNARSVTYSRIDRHVDLERQVAARFLDVGLSDLHVYLNTPFKALGEIRALESMFDKSVDDKKAIDESMIDKLDDAMSAVVQVAEIIKRRAGGSAASG